MRKLVVVEFVTLDGVVQAPGGSREDLDGGFEHGGWSGPFMAEHDTYATPLYAGAGAFLFGRRTYDIWAAVWPKLDDPIAAALNGRPKYVVSTTLAEAAWSGTTVIRTDVAETVAGLKEQPGEYLLVPGSSELAWTLMEHGLVDQYQLWLHPVVVGRGKRLFADGGPPLGLSLVDARITAGGLVITTYEPRRP
ncbi:dihydrofolate reductase family protein [Nonomuraea sp. NPDC050536]|uniref:dihydrofolate reductase family protein n=1 Tax=Nonomuraea sp. NPDC050536 TaxID=3364366 RepID=UPI0037C79CF0